jgi:Cu/Ag efflux pump CusA
MPPVRFRIRTIMIVIASLAALMALLRLAVPVYAPYVFSLVLAVMAGLLVALVVQFYIVAVYFWRARSIRREGWMTDNRRVRKSEADRSGEPGGA